MNLFAWIYLGIALTTYIFWVMAIVDNRDKFWKITRDRNPALFDGTPSTTMALLAALVIVTIPIPGALLWPISLPYNVISYRRKKRK
ncbi:hypothetical protein [Rhodococcus sp. 11-3]|uniref:hypothetical protein n=1 Tax=Rhodococcus sp. 11-3 TaxID=2854796 RepID=UPI002040EDAF|nr:hypothetical protein [Rhodococcus sp. 11-3]USC16995.1 hypothetical protein KZJ41_09075 [Rhodococcus sp. 11-3]